MKVVRDDIWLCTDCLFAAVNDDVSGVEYSLGVDTEESRARIAEIEQGLTRLGPHLVPDFDAEAGEGIHEHSRCRCDCCGTRLHGERHRFAVLGD
jgi:hypothetical protein